METPLNRSNITQELNLTKFTDDESRVEEPQFDDFLTASNAFLRMMHQGVDQLADQRFADAAETFAACLQLLEESDEPPAALSHSRTILHCNVALCRFHLQDLTGTERSLNDAKQALNFSPSTRSETSQLLYLKILCNYCVLYTRTRHFDNVQKIVKMLGEFLRLQPDAAARAQLVSQVVYMLFRSDSLTHFLPESLEAAGERATANHGVCLLVGALGHQAAGQPEKASAQLFKALEHWKNQGDDVMCLVVLRQLQQLYADAPPTLAKLAVYFNAQLRESGLEEAAFDELFEDFEVKLRVVREVAKCLQSLEQLHVAALTDARPRTDALITRVALRWGIRASAAAARGLAGKSRDAAAAQQLREAVRHMERTLALLEGEHSPAMLALLSKHPFVHGAVNRLKAALEGLGNVCGRCAYRHPFERVRAAGRQPAAVRRLPRPVAEPALTRRAREAVNLGDYLTKLNFTSGGSLRKYFRVFGAQSLRWGKKPALLASLRNCHSYSLQEVRGVVYGRCTATFQRGRNAGLEPWLCFSLVLQKRPLDIYCEEEKVNAWYLGLAEYVRQHNPRAYVLRKGQFLWRKFAMVIKYAVMAQVPERMKLKLRNTLSLAKAVILYGVLVSNAERGASAGKR